MALDLHFALRVCKQVAIPSRLCAAGRSHVELPILAFVLKGSYSRETRFPPNSCQQEEEPADNRPQTKGIPDAGKPHHAPNEIRESLHVILLASWITRTHRQAHYAGTGSIAGRGYRPAPSTIGLTASSHSIAMMCTPGTPSNPFKACVTSK